MQRCVYVAVRSVNRAAVLFNYMKPQSNVNYAFPVVRALPEQILIFLFFGDFS